MKSFVAVASDTVEVNATNVNVRNSANGSTVLYTLSSPATATVQDVSSDWVKIQPSGKKVGWIQEKGQTYYCDPSTLQNVRGKWQLIGKNYYYFDQLGRLIRNKWVGNYHVGDNGALEKNKWIGKYFVGENGKWIKKFKGGWYKINKKWYYYTKEGVKKTGWLKYKGNKYYLDKNGVRLTKWQTVSYTHLTLPTT